MGAVRSTLTEQLSSFTTIMGNHQGNPLYLVANAWVHERQTGRYPEGKWRCHLCNYGTTSLAYWDEHVASLHHKAEIEKKVLETGFEPLFKPRDSQVNSDSRYKPRKRVTFNPSQVPPASQLVMQVRRSSLPGDCDFSFYDSKCKPFIGRDKTLDNVRKQLRLFQTQQREHLSISELMAQRHCRRWTASL